MSDIKTVQKIVQTLYRGEDKEITFVDKLTCPHEDGYKVYVVMEGDKVTGFSFCEYYEHEIPELISNLKALKYLDMGESQISEIPSWIAGLEALQEFSISSDNIWELPEWISTLSELEKLYLNGCSIEELPEWIGNLSKLEKLYLGGCGIKELPDSICNLTELKELNLASTNLEKLPADFGKLKNLKMLNLNYTDLENLPDSFGDLSELEVLHLDFTRIEKLPESFENLAKLKSLYLPIFIELPKSIEEQIKSKNGILERRDGFLRKIDGKLLRNIPCHSRKSIEKLLSGEFPEKTAVISFRDVGTMPVDYSAKMDWVFNIELDNIRATDCRFTTFDQSYVTLTDELFPQVRELADFIRNTLDDNLNIICQCEAGFGLSTGCAAAIQDFLNEDNYCGDYSEGITLWGEVRPNVHVYNRIFNALMKEPCLPNFARLREQCKNTDYFACQVFLKNNTLELMINDLDKLNAIDMEQVVYFTGGWYESSRFAQIDTKTLPGWRSIKCRNELADMNAFDAFSVDILYGLIRMGNEVKTVESLIPKLYDFYNTDENLRSNEKRYRDFQEKWQSLIDRWKEWLIEEEE